MGATAKSRKFLPKSNTLLDGAQRQREAGVESVDKDSVSGPGMEADTDERGFVDVLSRSVSPGDEDHENPSSYSEQSLQGYQNEGEEVYDANLDAGTGSDNLPYG